MLNLIIIDMILQLKSSQRKYKNVYWNYEEHNQIKKFIFK